MLLEFFLNIFKTKYTCHPETRRRQKDRRKFRKRKETERQEEMDVNAYRKAGKQEWEDKGSMEDEAAMKQDKGRTTHEFIASISAR